MTSAEATRKLQASSVAIRGSDRSGGAGVIWSAGGSIVTNAHVVQSREPMVVLADGRSFRATILRLDRRRDLALLQIVAEGLCPAEIGDSGNVRVGQLVLAIGNPLGLVGAVTAGIIHAVSDRGWMETSVRLAPGNSGGMLADAAGRAIGINTMIQSGVALAIPSQVVTEFVRGTDRAYGAKAA